MLSGSVRPSHSLTLNHACPLKHVALPSGRVKLNTSAAAHMNMPADQSSHGVQYRGANKGLYVLLSRTQAGSGITVKQEQEEISRNHVQTFIYLSVVSCAF